MNPSCTVIVLDDHPLVARGMAQYLQALHPELAVSTAASWDELEQRVRADGCPSLLVADVWLADSNSLVALSAWRAHCGQTRWLAISGDDDASVPQRVRQAGAQGFVHKQAPPEVFAQACAAVIAGGEWFAAEAPPQPGGAPAREWTVMPAELGLTPRQGEILALIVQGLPNKRIALALGLSESTVKEHVTAILERLGVSSRVQAITRLQGRRLVVAPRGLVAP